MTDTVAITRWVVSFFILQICIKPFAERFLGRSCGILGVPLFLLLWAYLYWIWGVFGTLPVGLWSQWTSGLFAWVVFFILSKTGFQKFKKESFPKQWAGEISFWLIFMLSIPLRMLFPDLEHTEKFADMMIFQASALDFNFPPQDLWLAGYPLNYYYFGYLFFAPLSKVTCIRPEWAFHLSVSTVIALTGSCVFILARSLSSNFYVALGSALAVIVFSNWEWMGQLLDGRSFGNFLWWDSSRAIEGTITEFPFFSFLLGDLHPHFIALPWLTLTVFLIHSLCKALKEENQRLAMALCVISALSLGVHYPLNPWELPFLTVLTVLLLRKNPKHIVWIGIGAFLFYLPFWLKFERPASLVHFVPRNLRSSFSEFFLHWGVFFIPLLFVFFRATRNWKERAMWWALGISAFASLLLGVASGFVVGVITWVLIRNRKDLHHPETILLLLALTFIGICEWIHLDHLYGEKLRRMNTVFKFYTVGWWALGISVPLYIYRYWENLREIKVWAGGVLSLCIALSLVYPYAGPRSRLRSQPKQKLTLDGLAHWSRIFPGEREALEWIRNNTHPKDVIWEAVGPAYQHFARISTFSGRPTILGWANHERIWRSDGFSIAKRRQKDIRTLIQSSTVKSLTSLLKQYQVRWIVLGSMEHRQYPKKLIQTIQSFPRKFSNQKISIFKVL